MLLALIFNLYVVYRRNYAPSTRGHIYRVTSKLLLKVNRGVYGPEADNIRFIRNNTTIPVPRVVASARGHGKSFMLMTCIPGEELEAAWPKLNQSQRDSVVQQLRGFVDELRQLKPPSSLPPGAVCSLKNEPMHESRVASVTPFGPFANEDSFNRGLLHVIKRFVYQGKIDDIYSRMRADHQIVFTHGDFAPRNILVQGDKIVAVIDWEDSGWLPEYWELLKALWSPGSLDDSWIEAVKKIMPYDYEKELKLDSEMTIYMQHAL